MSNQDNIEPTRLVFKHMPTQAEIDAFVQSMDNCFIDTADYDATMVLARNTGAEVCDFDHISSDDLFMHNGKEYDLGELYRKLEKCMLPASGKSMSSEIFILDSLSALEDKNADKRR